MTQTEMLLKRLPNDIGGLDGELIQRTEHELEPWEKRCHARADVLDNILFAKRILTPSELAAEMDEVAARWDQEPRP
ncbi:hypothetical protein ABC766_18710 [Methylobacterium fujisawaense]|uniref:hypothetical protein n=1 Tax=Methylobacterium fujisawaense TaxID=107400 RepID=UPI0031F57AC4